VNSSFRIALACTSLCLAVSTTGAQNVRQCPLSERQAAFARPVVATGFVAGNVELWHYFKKAWWSGVRAPHFFFKADWDQGFRDQDKFGHMFGGFHLARVGYAGLRAACVGKKKAIFWSAAYAAAFQLQIEIFDGQFVKYGFSYADMIAEIRALDPKPGATYDSEPVRTIIPDLLMRPAPGDSWIIELNPDTMPRVLVNEGFHARIAPRANKADRVFLADQLASANWLVRSLQQRAQTILKVAAEIIRQQDGFLRLGVAHLRPLILRDIAEAVEMHESTVSRVTANKYIATPRGTFEMKYFFTTAIHGTNGGDSHSAEAVRHRIRGLIDMETVAEVLSDDAIVVVLRHEGVDIARRTVAKYREALRIPNSVQRRREKAVPA